MMASMSLILDDIIALFGKVECGTSYYIPCGGNILAHHLTIVEVLASVNCDWVDCISYSIAHLVCNNIH